MDPQSTESVASDESGAAPTYEESVNAIVSEMTEDDDGNWSLPEGEYSDEVVYSANAERRRRSTESALGKTRLQLKAKETVNEKLKAQLVARSRASLSANDANRLEELKYSDPDAWRREANRLEASAATTLRTELSTIDTEASQQAEKESRKTVLANFNTMHSGAQITEDQLRSDIPPRIVNKLMKGKVSFDQFLTEAHTYLYNPKTVGSSSKARKTPNLGKTGGSSTPSANALRKDTVNTYAKTIF